MLSVRNYGNFIQPTRVQQRCAFASRSVNTVVSQNLYKPNVKAECYDMVNKKIVQGVLEYDSGNQQMNLFHGPRLLGFAKIRRDAIRDTRDEVVREYMESGNYLNKGALFVKEMKNESRTVYRGIGTVLHNAVREFAENLGYGPKVYLYSLSDATLFHYKYGFKPIGDFIKNPIGPDETDMVKTAKLLHKAMDQAIATNAKQYKAPDSVVMLLPLK